MGSWPLLFSFFTSFITVFGSRQSGNIGLQCCQRVLKATFPEASYPLLQAYRHLPSTGRCPEYLEFNMRNGLTFCVRPRLAQKLKEFVDSRSRGSADAVAVDGPPRPALRNAAPTGRVGQAENLASTASLAWLQEKEPGTSPPALPFPRSTGRHGDSTTNTGPSAFLFPRSTGHHEEEVMTTIGPPTLPFLLSTERHVEEVTATIGPPTVPSPQSIGFHKEEGTTTTGPPGLSFPRATRPHEGMDTATTGPSASPFPGLKQQGVRVGPPTQPSPQRTGPSYRHERGDRTSPGHIPSEGSPKQGGAELTLGIFPNPSPSREHRRGPGEEAASDRTRHYAFLGLLVAVVCVVLLRAMVNKRAKTPEPVQGAQVRLIRYTQLGGTVVESL